MTVTIERPTTTQTGQNGVAPAAGPHYTKRRMHHIFASDGKALVVAMDGARKGPVKGLRDPRRAVQHVVDGGADAILTTFGMARATADVLRGQGLIIALDGPTDDTEDRVDQFGVEQALRFGADAVELKVFPGNTTATRIADLRRLVARCGEWGLPLLGEPIPVSFFDTSAHTLENVAKGARLAAECGVDFLKVHYVGPSEQYAEQVIAESYIPVLCLGGPAKDDPVDALRACHGAIQAGAKGIVFGRNIVAADRPDKMCAALGEVIHGGASAEAAAKHLSAQF